MKKHALAFALLTLALGAQAAVTPPKEAESTAAPVKASAPDAPLTTAAPVKVTGATTVAGSPPQLVLDGKTLLDPSFQVLFDVVKTNKSWKISEIKDQDKAYRVTMNSTTSKTTLAMDVAREMLLSLKLKTGDTVDVVTQVMGQDALIKFTKDKVPLGFMVNKLEPAKP